MNLIAEGRKKKMGHLTTLIPIHQSYVKKKKIMVMGGTQEKELSPSK